MSRIASKRDLKDKLLDYGVMNVKIEIFIFLNPIFLFLTALKSKTLIVTPYIQTNAKR